MNLIINEKLIKRNKTIGNVLSIVGIAVLGVGLVMNFNPTVTKTIISFAALIAGFIISQISTYFVSNFSRNPRMDEFISENLEKLNSDYTLYVYSSPVPILLVGPAGLWIPVTSAASGEIFFNKKWKQRGGSFLLKFAGQENIGKPAIDVEDNEKLIRKLLSDHFEENEMPPINPILVLIHPEVKIGDVEDAPNLIVKADALRRMIRKIDRKVEEKLPQDVLDKINGIFS